MLRLVPSLLTFWKDLSKMNVELCQELLLHLLRWSYGFYSLICECGVCVTLIDSWVIEESLCPWNKSNLIVIYDPFNELLDSVC